jgi:hypothetical protein
LSPILRESAGPGVWDKALDGFEEGRISQILEEQSENQKGGSGKPQIMIRKS